MSVDLSTRYLGLNLENPLVASSSPLTGHIDTLLRLEDSGVAAVVLPSLFEEQIEHEELELVRLSARASFSNPEAIDYFPTLEHVENSSQSLLELLTLAKQRLDIPVIASLNGTSQGGWTRYAKELQRAGADAIELNMYLLATDPLISGAEIEERYLALLRSVTHQISIPLAVKVGPYFSSIANMMVRLDQSGAKGLVLFNRFLQPDIQLETLQVVPNLILSSSAELRLSLRWIAILREHVHGSLAATSGAHTWEDMAKLILAGADVVCMTSALLERGPEHVDDVLDDLEHWMDQRGYSSIAQMRGSMAQHHYGDPVAFERANYMKALTSFTGPID